MAARKPQRRSDALRQERALERARQGAIERAQRGTWYQEMRLTLARQGAGVLLLSILVVLGGPCLFTPILAMALDQTWAELVVSGLLCMLFCAVVMAVLLAISLSIDTSRRLAKDALSERAMRRVLSQYEGDVPIGALEVSSEEGAERGAVSMVAGAAEGELSVAQDEARQ